MATPTELTADEQQVIEKYRWLKRTFRNAKLTIYLQERHGLDMEFSARVRMAKTLSPAVDD